MTPASKLIPTVFLLFKRLRDPLWNCLQTCAVLTKNDTVQSDYLAFLPSLSLSIVWNVQKSLPFLTLCGFHSSNLPRSVITVLSVWSSYFSWSSPAHPLGPESYVTFSKAASPDHSGRLDGSGLCVPQWLTFFCGFHCHIFSSFSV